MLWNREHNTEKSHVRVGPYFATLPSNVSNKGFKYLNTKKYACEKSFTESEFPSFEFSVYHSTGKVFVCTNHRAIIAQKRAHMMLSLENTFIL